MATAEDRSADSTVTTAIIFSHVLGREAVVDLRPARLAAAWDKLVAFQSELDEHRYPAGNCRWSGLRFGVRASWPPGLTGLIIVSRPPCGRVAVPAQQFAAYRVVGDVEVEQGEPGLVGQVSSYDYYR